MPSRWAVVSSCQASDWATVSKLLCDMEAAKVQKDIPNHKGPTPGPEILNFRFRA